jgi:hypothetical protein
MSGFSIKVEHVLGPIFHHPSELQPSLSFWPTATPIRLAVLLQSLRPALALCVVKANIKNAAAHIADHCAIRPPTSRDNIESLISFPVNEQASTTGKASKRMPALCHG